MQAALEISFYVLGVVFALGMLMVLLLIRDVFFHGRFSTVLPSARRVPTTALDAARETLKALQQALPHAHGERADTIAYEIRHLEHRIAALEDKTYADQSDYYAAVKARERAWREWRTVHEEGRAGGMSVRRRLRERLAELREQYRKLDRDVNEEYERAVARDALTREELRSQGALDPEVLAPPQAAAAKAGEAERAAGAAGGAAAEDKPEGAAPAQAGGGAAGRAGRWMTPLVPYPPAQGGLLGQADMANPDVQKSERTYVDPTFSMAGLPSGTLSGADLSRSSFAEVELVGVQHFVNCAFVAADLRRIELRRAETPHVFQDCDLHGASLAQAQLSAVVFRRCNLARTHWRSARLDRVKFESCNLEQVQWEGVDLSRTVMSDDMLQQADFEFASKPPLNLRPLMESPPEVHEPLQPGPPPAAATPPAPGAPAGGPETPAQGAAPEAPAPQAPAAADASDGTETAPARPTQPGDAAPPTQPRRDD
jgi:uncharacterized protein YjbI with pentapeptide repeats